MLNRFYASITEEPNTGCWLWIGQDHTSGYGTFVLQFARGKRTQMRAHRFSYELHTGERIPEGAHHGTTCVLHRCDTPLCVNPDHLFLGTQQENRWDTARKGRAKNARSYQTECKRGHPLAGDNLRLQPWTTRAGVAVVHRICRTCEIDNQRARYRRKHGVTPDRWKVA